MAHYALNETLTGFLSAVDVATDSGLAIDEVELELPLEISLSEHNGELVVLAQSPASIYHNGFESLVQRTRLVAVMHETTQAIVVTESPAVQQAGCVKKQP